MGNEIKIHSVQLLQNPLACISLSSAGKAYLCLPNFCQDTRVSVGFLCVLFPAQVYFLHTAAGGGRCAKVQCLALVPQLRCADVSGTVASASQGWKCWSLWNGRKSHWFTFSDALALQLPLCARGWHPSHSRGRVEGKERTGGDGEGEWRLERGGFSGCWSPAPSYLNPHPRLPRISLLLPD